MFYDTSSSSTTTTASESDPAAKGAGGGSGIGLHQRIRVTSSSRLSRSRSLDKGRHNAPLRSRSLDCGGERRSSPDEVRSSVRYYESSHFYLHDGPMVHLANGWVALTI